MLLAQLDSRVNETVHKLLRAGLATLAQMNGTQLPHVSCATVALAIIQARLPLPLAQTPRARALPVARVTTARAVQRSVLVSILLLRVSSLPHVSDSLIFSCRLFFAFSPRTFHSRTGNRAVVVCL